jgi:beta-phosphoglucomutase-like phosphatase (HAD superfamily)
MASNHSAYPIDVPSIRPSPLPAALEREHDGTGEALVGVCKPDPRIYRHASNALGLDPGQYLFVDDEPENVTGAINLGYAARLMCRNIDPVAQLPSITSLTELLELF